MSMRIKREWMASAFLAATPLGLWRCSGVNSVVIIDGGNLDSTANTSGGSGSGVNPVNSVGIGSSGSGGDNGGDMPDGGNGQDATSNISDGGMKDVAMEAAPPCIGPEGGPRCTPGAVACGGDSGVCATAMNLCCQPNPPDGGPQGTCQPNSSSCANSEVAVQCEEATDCPKGNVCCEMFPGYATLGPTSCMPSCTGGTYQICRTHAECGMGDAGGQPKCVLQSCSSPFGFGPTVTLEACAVGTTTSGALPYCTAN
jgi:hypothetical protein